MADRDSSANHSSYSRSTQGIPQFGSFGPIPDGKMTRVSSNPQRVTEERLTEYMDKQKPRVPPWNIRRTETQRLMSFDTSLEYHDAYRKDRDNATSGVDLTTAGGGPSIDPPSYDQQKKE